MRRRVKTLSNSVVRKAQSLKPLSLAFIFFSSLSFIYGCEGSLGGGSESVTENDTVTIEYTAPVELNDQLQVSTFDAEGLDQAAFGTLLSEIGSGLHSSIDGLAVHQNGKLLYEQTFRQEFDQYDEWINNRNLNLHAMHSVSKSVTAILVGIAVEQGLIFSLDDPVLNYFPWVMPEQDNEAKQKITIRHLLSMRVGLEWDEFTYPYGDANNSLTKLVSHANWTEAFFDLPVVASAGSEYTYNTAATNVLLELVDRVTPRGAEEFAQNNLFTPLSISLAQWDHSPRGIPVGGSGLYLDLRSATKIGLLMLGNGEFDNLQVVSSAWVRNMSTSYTRFDAPYTTGYSFQWWTGYLSHDGQDYDYVSARGFGSQFILVIPDLDLVIVTFGKNYINDKFYDPITFIQDDLLPLLIN